MLAQACEALVHLTLSGTYSMQESSKGTKDTGQSVKSDNKCEELFSRH